MDTSSSSIIDQNVQHSLDELLVQVQILTEQQQQQQQSLSIVPKKRRKRCHGDKKRRRLKKKCDRQAMSTEEKAKLLEDYDHRTHNKNQRMETENNNQDIVEAATTIVENMEITTTTTKSNKRKQITRSTSQLSISQALPTKKKKMKTNEQQVMITPTMKTNYKLPLYLKVLPSLLFQQLRLQLKQSLKTKDEQTFIYHRLQLLDRQNRLHHKQNLWETYQTIGTQQQLWPNQVYSMAKTHEHELCKQFVKNHFTEIQRQFEQYKTELKTQEQSCPATLLPVETLDHNLKDFVELQQKYLSNKMNAQLKRFKNTIDEKEVFQNLSTYNLTIDQNITIDQLIQLKQTQLEVYEEFVQFETRISNEILPENYDNLDNFIAFDSYLPVIKDDIAIEFQQQQYTIIQETKRTWLDIYMQAYEIKIQGYEHQYLSILNKFEQDSAKNIVINRKSLFEFFTTYMNNRIDRIKQEIHDEKIPFYQRKLLRNRRDLLSIKKIVAVSPQVILDILDNPFTVTELNYILRSLKYIRPNQSALYSYAQQKKKIKNEVNDIMHKLKRSLSTMNDNKQRIPRTAPLFRLYATRLKEHFTFCYMTSMPFIDLLRARQELKIVQSIRRKLIKYKLILRTTDKSRVPHIGRAIDYQRKAIEYRTKTGAYIELTFNPFNDILYKVTRSLHELASTGKITQSQKEKMMPVRNETELAYMYIIPKPHKKGTSSIRPIINTIHAATTKISKFLDQLIRPLFYRHVRQTMIVDGTDLLDRLQQYIDKGYLTSSTLFITSDITNLYTMVPQEESLVILAEFLHEYGYEHINGITIDTIIELARIVLEGNVFVYDDQFYQQIIGGAMGSAFTLTLANIFMWKWEKQTILPKLAASPEIFGRYIDDFIFTSNESEETIKQWLEEANKFHPNIKLTYKIAKTLPFLDVLISNNHGRLTSSVYHKLSAQPAILSFLSDHPRHIFRNIIQTLLTRAVRYSSTFEAFNIERRAIQLKLLYNKYPGTFINKQFQRFFQEYMSSSSAILPLISDENQFFMLRQKLLTQPSIKQAIVAKSANRVHLIHDNSNNIPEAAAAAQPQPRSIEITVEQKQDKFKNAIFIHCTHEGRFQGMKRELHDIHQSFFESTPNENIRLIVGNRNNRNTDFELARKRPHPSLLKIKLDKRKIKKQTLNEPPSIYTSP